MNDKEFDEHLKKIWKYNKLLINIQVLKNLLSIDEVKKI